MAARIPNAKYGSFEQVHHTFLLILISLIEDYDQDRYESKIGQITFTFSEHSFCSGGRTRCSDRGLGSTAFVLSSPELVAIVLEYAVRVICIASLQQEI